MKSLVRQIFVGISLAILSSTIYAAQVVMFHDERNTIFYLLQDLAFIPIQVLLITFILNRLLSLREKREMLKKMNMVIGAFFSSVGTELLSGYSKFHEDNDKLSRELLIDNTWTDTDFKDKAKMIANYDFKMDYRKGNLTELKEFAVSKKDFMLSLLENANLLEHDSFTDMLWAIFHVSDELSCRDDVTKLPPKDYEHLENDIIRAYSRLIYEWLSYMNHLQKDYPYLYSLAARKNPFNSNARAIFK